MTHPGATPSTSNPSANPTRVRALGRPRIALTGAAARRHLAQFARPAEPDQVGPTAR